MILNILLEFIKYISIVLACWTVIYGIDSWRREFKGKRQLELAEDILCLFYEVRDAIQSIRHPFSYGEEGKTRKITGEESARQKESRDKAYVLFERYNRHIDLFNKLYAARYRFMATFGKEYVKPFDTIRHVVSKMFVSARMLASMWGKDISYWSEERIEKYCEDQKRHESVFWWAGEDDPIEKDLNTAVEEIEKVCISVINAKSTLFGVLNKPIFK